jgi:hypothetical protein
MVPSLAYRIATLLVAAGIFLGGFGPAMAAPQATNMPHMAMMPGMVMPENCTAKVKCPPQKPMSCDGTDCGCCLAGTCAAPTALDQAGLKDLLGRTAEKEIDRNTIPNGITFPPALPPPIA